MVAGDTAQKPMPFLVRARLTKLVTDDGLVEMNKGCQVGRVFLVDLSTAEDAPLLNERYKVSHVKRVVREVEGNLLPMECLELLP